MKHEAQVYRFDAAIHEVHCDAEAGEPCICSGGPSWEDVGFTLSWTDHEGSERTLFLKGIRALRLLRMSES